MSLKKVSFVSAGNLFNAGIGFIFLTAIAKNLSLEDFGKYAVLISLLTAIARLMDFGTNSMFVAKAITDKEVIEEFYALKLFLFILTVPITLITLYYFGLLTGQLFVLFLLGLIAYGLNFSLYALFQRHQQYLELILINTFPSIVKGVFAILILTKLYTVNLTNAFGIFSISIATCALLIPFISREFKKLEVKFHLPTTIATIKHALSPGLSQIIYESWPSINNAIAKLINGFADIGVFYLANKISNIFALMSYAIFTVLLPKNANRKKLNQTYDFKETAILGVILFALSFITVLISDVFVTKIFGSKFQGSIKILDILIFAAAITAIQNFSENYFFVEKKTNYLLIANLTKLVTLVILATIFMSVWGLAGLALSNLISSALGLILIMIMIRSIETGQLK